MIVWAIAGLLGLATGMRIGWALANEQSVVSTAMILALGSLGTAAALSWPPLTLFVDSALGWPNIAMGFSQVALIGSAAGSAVMITSVTSRRPPAVNRRLSVAQYSVAAVVAALSLTAFFAAGPRPQTSPTEYLRQHLGGPAGLLPLAYLVAALSLVAWAGLRHSNRSRRGRALFVFTLGMTLMLLAGVAFLFQVIADDEVALARVGTTLLGCAMPAVAAGALLPSIEDWFGARRELALIRPILTELGRRHPEMNLEARTHGPRVFRVAEKMSLISDALFLEATAASDGEPAVTDPDVAPGEQALTVARWIDGRSPFPGLGWLRQPETYSDREWILAIAGRYRDLMREPADAPPRGKVRALRRAAAD
ncbi:hypothetical protein JRC04_27425 [Mycolicibacterium sp. S2-37]|uniref:hypothetical protein n=1 Tax=Mycolicibacterium sp. S2-37 TaxID=2810297 RepID=UPI001A950106|nr:hypothetical protein [Mycolicibacterium sp. S2-37]MBO0679813.1 hypothetical protein [Mycolicibacterium sp. S2-37]MBO0681210.1 hypothetical protein [Mycolicibacterium sp. S2-37]